MKIRTGFVSNSSTSSFLIYGIYQDSDDIFEKLKATGFIPEDNDSFDKWFWAEGEKKLKEKNLIMEFPHEGDYVALGRSWDTIKDDETGGQFKETTAQAIKEITGKDLILDTHEDAWRDG
jgi:hypothetical protein